MISIPLESGSQQGHADRLPLGDFSHARAQRGERVAELIAAAVGQFLLALVEDAVGEGVLAGGMRRIGGPQQVHPADRTVLVIAE